VVPNDAGIQKGAIRPVPRYFVGDSVKVTPMIATRHAGHIGTILTAKYNPQDRTTLDKYLVQFDSGEQGWFWSIQLNSHGESKSAAD
jgi:hypothetical protein